MEMWSGAAASGAPQRGIAASGGSGSSTRGRGGAGLLRAAAAACEVARSSAAAAASRGRGEHTSGCGLWREAAATSAALLWLRSAASDGGSSLQRRVRTLPHGEAKPIIASARAACRRQTRGQVRLQRIHPVRSYI